MTWIERQMKSLLIYGIIMIVVVSSVEKRGGMEAKGDLVAELLANGVCEDFEASPQPCISIMVGSWRQVWTVPAYGITQEYLQARMLQPVRSDLEQRVYVSYLDVIPTLTPKCALLYSQLMCPTFFQPCVNLPNSSRGLPLSVCPSVCQNYNAECGLEAPIDCNTVNPLTGLPFWPATNSCTTNELVQEPLEYPCPPPLVYVAPSVDKNTGLSCAVPCDVQIYWFTTKHNFDTLFIIISVFAWMSLFCSLAVIIIYCTYPSLREYPARLAIFSAIGLLVANIGLVGSSVQDPKDFMCSDDNIGLARYGWCGFAGWCLYFGGMLVGCWWIVQVFVLWYNIGLQRYKERLDQKYEWVFHVWCWGYSIIMGLCILLIDNNGGARGTYPWCFTDSNIEGLVWGMFYGVLIAYLTLMVPMTLWILWRLLREGYASTMSGKALAPFFLNIAGFCAWFLIALVAIVGFRAYTWDIQAEGKAGIERWYQCIFTTTGSWHDCPMYYIRYGWAYTLGITVSFTAVVLFIFVVPLRERVRLNIATSFSNLLHGRPFLDGLTTDAGNSSSGRRSRRNTNLGSSSSSAAV